MQYLQRFTFSESHTVDGLVR